MLLEVWMVLIRFESGGETDQLGISGILPVLETVEFGKHGGGRSQEGARDLALILEFFSR